MQIAGADDTRQFALDPCDLFVYLPPIRFNLGFTGPPKKTAAAALSLQMGPATDEAAALIGKMGKVNLQTAFPGSRAGPKYFQNQTGTIDDLAVPRPFKITLLDRGNRKIDYRDGNFFFGDDRPVGFHRAWTQQSTRPRPLQTDDIGMYDVQINRLGQTNGLFQT